MNVCYGVRSKRVKHVYGDSRRDRDGEDKADGANENADNFGPRSLIAREEVLPQYLCRSCAPTLGHRCWRDAAPYLRVHSLDCARRCVSSLHAEENSLALSGVARSLGASCMDSLADHERFAQERVLWIFALRQRAACSYKFAQRVMQVGSCRFFCFALRVHARDLFDPGYVARLRFFINSRVHKVSIANNVEKKQ